MDDLQPDLDLLHHKLIALEEQVRGILTRNERVEAHKRWETSKIRIVCLTGVTYITMILVFYVLGSSMPWFDAVVPTTGYFLSTLSLSFIRERWEKSN